MSGTVFPDPYWGNKRGVIEELPSQELIAFFKKTYIEGHTNRVCHVNRTHFTYMEEHKANTAVSFSVKELQQEYREYKLKQLGI